MTVDKTRLRIVAVGNHRAGYHGMVEILGDATGFTWVCPTTHRHPKTDEARNCARQAIRESLTEWTDDWVRP